MENQDQETVTARVSGSGNTTVVVDGNRTKKSFPWWVTFLVVPIATLALIGLGFGIYKTIVDDDDNDNKAKVAKVEVSSAPADPPMVVTSPPAPVIDPETISKMITKAVEDAVKKAEAEKPMPKTAVEAALPDPKDQELLDANAEIARLREAQSSPEGLQSGGQIQQGSEMESVRAVNDHFRKNTVYEVVRLGRTVQKNGKTWIPLFTQEDPNSKQTLLAPVTRSVSDAYKDLRFVGVERPSTGQLAVFDIVRDSKTGNAFSVLAWCLD